MIVVTMDLEIQKSVAEVGGWFAAKSGLAGISAAVTLTEMRHDYIGRPEVKLWDQHVSEELVCYLEAADLVVTYNGKGFDLAVLQGVCGRQLVVNHYDILEEIWRATGNHEKGWKLDDVARRALNRGKLHSGAMAPKLAEQGRWGELFQYCLDDTELTRELFIYIIDNGFLPDPNMNPMYLRSPES